MQPLPQRARGWQAKETWLNFADFKDMLHSPPYDVLIGCDHWEVSRVNSSLFLSVEVHHSVRIVQR